MSFYEVFSECGGYNYLLFLPKGYRSNEEEEEEIRRWPLILFLHGANHKGKDLHKLYQTPFLKHLREQRADFPFIAVCPQCPMFKYWKNEQLSALLDEVIDEFAVDVTKIYITGINMGGYATFSLAMHEPHRFAACVPVCGGGDPNYIQADRISHIPFWIFHSQKEDSSSSSSSSKLIASSMLTDSEKMVRALRECGASEVHFTSFRGGASTKAYHSHLMFDWLMQHSALCGKIQKA